MRYFLLFLLIMSIITFMVYGIDKKRAIKNKWRIKERTILLLAFLGGAIGGIIGMNFFHHKTTKEHWYFAAINYFSLLLEIIISVIIYMNFGL